MTHHIVLKLLFTAVLLIFPTMFVFNWRAIEENSGSLLALIFFVGFTLAAIAIWFQ